MPAYIRYPGSWYWSKSLVIICRSCRSIFHRVGQIAFSWILNSALLLNSDFFIPTFFDNFQTKRARTNKSKRTEHSWRVNQYLSLIRAYLDTWYRNLSSSRSAIYSPRRSSKFWHSAFGHIWPRGFEHADFVTVFVPWNKKSEHFSFKMQLLLQFRGFDVNLCERRTMKKKITYVMLLWKIRFANDISYWCWTAHQQCSESFEQAHRHKKF